MPARCDHRKRNHQSHPRDGLTCCCADASRLIGPPNRDRRIGSAGHFATRDVGGWADKGCARHNDGVVGGGVQLVPTAPAYPCARGISASDLHGRRKCRRIVGNNPCPARHPSSPSHSRSSAYASISSVTYTQARDHEVGHILVVVGDLRCRAEGTLRH